MPIADPATHRAPQRAGDIAQLTPFLNSPRLSGITDVFVIRTSSTSRRDFQTMFETGVALRPEDPDVKVLRELGHRIVLDDGKADRERLGAMELRRGSVPGVSGRRARGRLGWLVPIGRTLFVLYLESARHEDLPGASADTSRNAFTEALCEVIRVLRPSRIFAPLLTRLVRDRRFGEQLFHTLRQYDVEVWVDGARMEIAGDEGEMMTALRSMFAAQDATSLVSRLGGIEAGLYAAGEWYQTAKLLPFTWRSRGAERVNPMTGATEWVVPDFRDIEVAPGSVEVFDAMVKMLCDPKLTLPEIGVRLGALGVRERAPRNFGAPRTLDQLAQPGNAVSSLLDDRWLDAWLTGAYRTEIKLKADLRKTHPSLAGQIIEKGKDLFLSAEIALPMPQRGWWLTQDDHDRILAVRKAPTPQRVGRAASGTDRRPLASLAQWDDPETSRQWRLGTFDSTESYSLLWRPLSAAYDAEGHAMGWSKTHKTNKVAAVGAPTLHTSIGEALIGLAANLDDQAAPLIVEARASTVDGAGARARAAAAAADADLAAAKARRKGIRMERQVALGRGDDDEVALLDAEEADAKEAIAAAERHVAAAAARLAEAEASPAGVPEATAEAQMSTLEVVGVALTRFGAFAPAELSDALARLFGTSLRAYADADSLALTWQVDVSVPLTDGTTGTYRLTSPAPVPGIAFTVRTASGHTKSPNWQDKLAGQYFGCGLGFVELGALRNLDGSGKADTYLVKQMKLWLRDHGVPQPLRSAAMDAPAEVRRVLYRLLSGGEAHNPYEARLAACYTDPDARWGLLWAGAAGDDVRAVAAAVRDLGAGGDADAIEVCAAAQVSMSRLVELTAPARPLAVKARTSTGPAFTRTAGKWGAGQSAPGRRIAAMGCTHDDCAGGKLVQLNVPELGQAGLLCPICRRTPDDAEAVFPEVYLRPWRGGRKTTIEVDGQHVWVGTRLAED